jgi:CheY-like chemotaxis protein
VSAQAKRIAGSAPTVPMQPVVVPGSAAAGTTSQPPCHVLLVEDHEDTALMMRRLLVRRGYAVTLATTLAEAMDAVNSRPFDLLLSDLGLPDGSGLDLMRALSLRSPKLPAIALSGYGMPDDVRKSLEVGFLAHLSKPVAVERLWATIEQAVAACAAPTNV